MSGAHRRGRSRRPAYPQTATFGAQGRWNLRPATGLAPRPRRRRDLTMNRTLALLTLALAALLAFPAAAPAMPRQTVAFEAPRELLSLVDQERVINEIQGFGITRIRQLVYWNDFAPSPNAQHKPTFDAKDPDAYPKGTWDRLDLLIGRARERGIAVHLTLTGPVPKWATSTKKDHVTKPSPAEFRDWATAVGRRYGADVEHVVDLERAQPAAVPRRRSTARASRTRRTCTGGSTRSASRASSAARTTRRTRSCSARPRRAATRRSCSRWTSSGGCCAWTRTTRRRRSRAGCWTRTATRTTRTRRRRARGSCRRTPTT